MTIAYKMGDWGHHHGKKVAFLYKNTFGGITYDYAITTIAGINAQPLERSPVRLDRITQQFMRIKHHT